MLKRRERVEQWRKANKVQMNEQEIKEQQEALATETTETTEEAEEGEPQPKKKGKYFDEDEALEEDGETADVEMQEAQAPVKEEAKVDEVDPLDAFMNDVQMQMHAEFGNTLVVENGRVTHVQV